MDQIQPTSIARAVEVHCQSRKTDPDTSREAARNHQPRANSNAGKILAVLKTLHAPPTAAELAVECGLEHVETQRRLSDLWSKGLVAKHSPRICLSKGTKMTTWLPIGEGGGDATSFLE